MLQDEYRLRRRLQKLKRAKQIDQQEMSRLGNEINQSVETVRARRASLPAINFPDDLPIALKSDAIKKAIRDNQVTIICGETGSGKTTQLPKICLDIGLGIRGKIGHTQPRRIAARTVAARIAEELGVEPGREVGFKVRFSDKSNDSAWIKLMTDGILLAECHHDPFLNQYDTIIIDEAHERSLNIDFLLGYLKRLIRKRRDLKVIITSATIDPERFSKHFDNAPVINVSGRTWPVEVRYRPFRDVDDDADRDLPQAIIDAVYELSRIDRGDILVFLSGERDIRDVADALAGVKDRWLLDNTEVLPMLARLSMAEQNRIFQASSRRRIVLATNVAETSLTVPGIKYVIDSGLARISRYSWRSKIQRLPIEKISRASADQRKGRCGRMVEGICIRLYDEDDFMQRAEFTEPEILRTSLASVILQMEKLQLGSVEKFPFVEPPEQRLVNDGYKLLFELGAIDSTRKLTRTGKHLAHFPVDPKLARMLLQARTENALAEVSIIVSALAVQDPRERPLDRQQAADEKHAAFTDTLSDFVFYLNLWNAWHAEKKIVSGNQLRKWCRRHFISWLRMREWIDTNRQIGQILTKLRLESNTTPASFEQIHRSLLTGLLANIGVKDEGREYQAARNKRFTVFPGSVLFKSPPKWIMAAEVVETTRVYARCNARIDPGWIEELGAHLLKYSFSNPHWEKKRAQVVASEQTSLYGLIINSGKKVEYGRINPLEAKEIFIRDALIAGDLESKAEFYRHNQRLLKELEMHEAKSRRRDIIVDDKILYEFYNTHLPDDVYSGTRLNKWLASHPEQVKALFLTRQDLMQDDARLVSDSQFPDHLEMKGSRFPLEYHFDPRNHCDGVTLITPLAVIDAINPQRCEWLVNGLLHEKMVALIRSLPKQIRKNFVPAPNFAAACMQSLQPSETALTAALATRLKEMTGITIPGDAWNTEGISRHLLMNFRVIDNDRRVIAEGRDLLALKESLSGIAGGQDVLAAKEEACAAFNRDNVDPSVIDSLGRPVEIELQGVTVMAYPALVKDGNRINLRAFEQRIAAHNETQLALRQFVINALSEQIKYIRSAIPDIDRLCLKYTGFGSCDQLKQEIIEKTINEVILYKEISSSHEFNERVERGKSELHESMIGLSQLISEILDAYRDIRNKIKKPALSQLDTVSDIQQQLDHLFPKKFITTVSYEWLQQYPRYLSAISKRLEKAKTAATRDRQLRLQFSALWDEYSKRRASLSRRDVEPEGLEYYRWMLEEYRVSLFAQELKTRFPVSEKRLRKYLDTMEDS